MAVKRLSNFRIQYDDGNGALASGYRLFFYAAGSSTKQNTFNSSTGSVANSNPIVLNALGEPAVEIWLTTGQNYKVGLAIPGSDDPPASFVWTEDNISGVNDATVTLDQWVTGPTPTFVSATQFTLVGDQTSIFHVGRRVKTTNSGGTIYSTITVSAFTTLTTVTVVNDSGSLDSGLSAVSYGLLGADNNAVPVLVDTYPLRSGSSDKTKKVRLEVDGLTTGTTRTLTVQDSDHTLVGRDTTDTLTNKSFIWVGTTLFAIVTKRKTADESVTSSTVLQDDDHLSFAIAANEEWLINIALRIGTSLAVHGIKLAITAPAGATIDAEATLVGVVGADGGSQSTQTSGAALDFGTARFASSSFANGRMAVWVLNGATPGNVTLQFAQSTSNGTAVNLRKGSALIAHRIA